MSEQVQVSTHGASPAMNSVAYNGMLQRSCDCGIHIPGGQECDGCKKKKMVLQRHSSGIAAPGYVPHGVNEVLGSSGHPMDSETRSFMEPRFGMDFSRVRVHTDVAAAASAQAL